MFSRDWETTSLDLSRFDAAPLIAFTATKKTDCVFLSSEAIAVLRNQQVTLRDHTSKFVFPGRRFGQCIVNISKPWRLVCEAACIENFRIHDLRHTAASIAVGEGIALPIIGRLLGHSQTQTTARYAHVDADPALRAADAIGRVIGKSI